MWNPFTITHVWSLDGEHHVLTSHLLLEHITSFEQIDGVRVKAMEALKDYDFAHHPIQVEIDPETCKFWYATKNITLFISGMLIVAKSRTVNLKSEWKPEF